MRKEIEDFFDPNFLQKMTRICFEINNETKLNCDEAISLFLIFMYSFVSPKFYSELVILMIYYREMLNSKNHPLIN